MGKLNRRILEKKYCECIDNCGTEIPLHCHFVPGHQNKSNIGTHHSPESNEQSRQSNLKTWQDEELLQRHSKNAKEVWVRVKEENPDKEFGFKGPHTAESNEKNRQAHLGKPSPLKGTGKPLSPSQPCACGCLEMTKPGNTYIHGHANKGKGVPKVSLPCECGCLEMAKPGNRFIKGHQRRGKQGTSWNKGLTKETDPRVAQMAESNKGRSNGPMPQETIEKIRATVTEIWKTPGYRENISEQVSGLNHPFYRNRPGLSPDDFQRDYPFEWTERLKESIRERDGRKCRICSKSEEENGVKLDVHHIDYGRENLDPDNLAALCKSCHGKTVGNRPYWISFFKDQQNNANADSWLSSINPSTVGSGYIPDPYQVTQMQLSA